MKYFFFTGLLLSTLGLANAQTAKRLNFTVKADSIKAHVQPTMYGIFFEDINMAADGGVYAELVKNRSFEFNTNLMGWAEQRKDGGNGTVSVVDRKTERPENPHYLTLNVSTPKGYYGLSNEGFGGMGIRKGEMYNFSVFARQHVGSKISLLLELHDSTGAVIGKTTLTPQGTEWKRYHATIQANTTTPKAKLYIWAANKGSIDLDMISLFPTHTWKNRPGGLRADLVQKLYDLKPGFLRFPGGCIVEGRDLANRYQWKKTIGDIDKRENIMNRWNVEFEKRRTPDYYQTFGLGFMEYFMLAEDIGAEPLPILNCGMACQYNTGQLVPLNQIDPYIQDALDLIEFANGSADTKWGKLRIALGHPKPFNLKMMGVGNEQWGEQYIERWKVFEKALKDKYPQIQLISSAGPDPSGDKFDYLNATLRGFKADILDEHYYRNPDWFFKSVTRYDNYDRKGTKIFAGEYAAHSPNKAGTENANNWQSAIAEAAFMTGLERNADVVLMASYAPLLAKVDAWQWKPDLIWFDNLNSYATPNYYVQQLYSLNKGTDVVPLTLNGKAVTGQDGQFASAVLDKKNNELIIKIINTGKDTMEAAFDISGAGSLRKDGLLTVLQSDDLHTENSMSNPSAVKPHTQTLTVNGKNLVLDMKPYSFNVIRLKFAAK
ncbi:alpha-L-arabinofuranosidase C-terminal domain-containing protein [Mucilaginibacter sp. 44-25]|uniref:alpha-L-arabinofuranosidase C-terminal domain-containing protein n=1 Tax=Mucilaginibacter sp. 44-25 TaxID=1895794 RepID=UPI0009668E52|nr:alpha-L-arabinofuranosidase C-terminal domain-containing protein [Mucilaginibacter sp. 44-25]OJW13295.1 MAG: alpha-L-arabinofuranosidase [Mucilaginibacter sp. 44-25]